MSHKHLLVQSAAREKILHGALALADALRVTLGPKSKCVLIEKKWGGPLVCNDGVTIAKEFELEDREENLGAQVIRQAAERTGDLVGDGTTTSTLVAAAIFSEGVKNVAAGASAIELKRGLDRGLGVVVARLKALSRPVADRKQRVQVATISAHNDPAIGELVADALERVGVEGTTSVEEAKGTETTVEVVEGMRLDRGYLSPYFITDAEKMKAILEDPVILLYEKKIASMADLGYTVNLAAADPYTKPSSLSLFAVQKSAFAFAVLSSSLSPHPAIASAPITATNIKSLRLGAGNIDMASYLVSSVL